MKRPRTLLACLGVAALAVAPSLARADDPEPPDRLRLVVRKFHDYVETTSVYRSSVGVELEAIDPAMPPAFGDGFFSEIWDMPPNPFFPSFSDWAMLSDLEDPAWNFHVGVQIEDFDRGGTPDHDGIDSIQLRLDGKHLRPPDGTGMNDLPPLLTTSDVNVVRNRSRYVKTWGVDPHGTRIDSYGVQLRAKAGPDLTRPIVLIDPDDPNLVLRAAHAARPDKFFARADGPALGASGSAFFVSASPSGAEIGLTSGVIDFLDPGGSAGAFLAAPGARAFAPQADDDLGSDPLLDRSLFSFGPSLAYLGFDAERGLHRFEGGAFSIRTLGVGSFAFEAAFDELVFDPEAGRLLAFLTRVDASDDLDPDLAPSAFLDAFTDAHLFGLDPNRAGILLSIDAPDLDVLTAGFTQSHFQAEVTFSLTGADVPEPGVLKLLGAALGLLGLQRLRSGAGRVAGPRH